MSHTVKPWQPGDGTNPYGRPGKTGNAHEAWRRFSVTPCPKCGAHAKRMKIEDDVLTIICGEVSG